MGRWSDLTPDLNSSMSLFFSSWSSTQYTLGMTNSDTTLHSGHDLDTDRGEELLGNPSSRTNSSTRDRKSVV